MLAVTSRAIIWFRASGIEARTLSCATRIYHDLPCYTTLWYTLNVVFIESRAFTRRLLALGKESLEVLSCSTTRSADGSGRASLAFARHGPPIPDKRGGFRYLYLYVIRKNHIHLLHLFDKDEREDLDVSERDDLRLHATWIKGQQ